MKDSDSKLITIKLKQPQARPLNKEPIFLTLLSVNTTSAQQIAVDSASTVLGGATVLTLAPITMAASIMTASCLEIVINVLL